MDDIPAGFVPVDQVADKVVAAKPAPRFADVPEGFYHLDTSDPQTQKMMGIAKRAAQTSDMVKKAAADTTTPQQPEPEESPLQKLSPFGMLDKAAAVINYPIQKAGQAVGALVKKGAELVLPEDTEKVTATKPSPAALPFLPTPLKAGDTINELTPLMQNTPAPEILGDAANLATQLYAPGVVAKGISSLIRAPAAVERKIGQKLSELPNVALARRTNAAAEAATYPSLTAPDIPSSVLYDRVGEANPTVELSPLKPVVQRVLEEEKLATPGLKLPTSETVATGLNKFFQAQKPETTSVAGFAREIQQAAPEVAKGTAPFQQVRVLMKRLNGKIDKLKQQGGEGLGDMLQLKKGLIESLENSANDAVGPAYQDLRAANMAYRNEYAMEKTADIIGSATRNLEGRSAEAQNITGTLALRRLNKALADDPWLEGSFKGDSLEKIKDGLAKIGELPLFGAPTGVDAGSRNVLGKIIKGEAAGSVIGGALGHMFGSAAVGAAVGGQLGAVTAVKASEVLARALAQPKGVALVERMLHASPSGLTAPQVATLESFVRGAQAEQVPDGDLRGLLIQRARPAMAKDKNKSQPLKDLGLQQ